MFVAGRLFVITAGRLRKENSRKGKNSASPKTRPPNVQATFTDEEAFIAKTRGHDKGKTTKKTIEGLSDDALKTLVPFVLALA